MINYVLDVPIPVQLKKQIGQLSLVGLCAKELFLAVMQKHLTGHNDWIYGCLSSAISDALQHDESDTAEYTYLQTYNDYYTVLCSALCMLEETMQPFIENVLEYSANDIVEVMCYEQSKQYTLLVKFKQTTEGSYSRSPLPF